MRILVHHKSHLTKLTIEELLLQAKGLSGDLPWFWPYFNNSVWVGGNATNNATNNVFQYIPYYLKGLVPLSYLVDDENLNSVRDKYCKYILMKAKNMSYSEGWLGPPVHSGEPYAAEEYWSAYLAVEAFESLAEADSTQYEEIVTALIQHHSTFYRHLKEGRPPLAKGRWAFGRYSEALVGIQWLLDQPSSVVPQTALSMLWDLMRMIRTQATVANLTNWEQWYRHGDPFAPWHDDSGASGAQHLMHHGVDVGEAMKTGPLWWRVSGKPSDLNNSWVALQWADYYAHMSDGMYFADEMMNGNNTPSRGTETCSVVETMYSMRVAWEITANVTFMDRLERLAFNSLPAALYPDVSANVYHHSSNQITADRGAYEYSLFFCCSANVHQGWPKFAGSVIHAVREEEALVVSTFVPSFTSLSGLGETTVELIGSYPFSDKSNIQVNRTTLEYKKVKVRIPCWTDGATIQLLGSVQFAPACVLFDLALPGDKYNLTLEVTFHNRIHLKFWQDHSTAPGAVEVHRGPITFALRPKENVSTVPIAGASTCATHKVTASSPWNYGLLVDPAAPDKSLHFE
eukprot:gene5083-6187_t